MTASVAARLTSNLKVTWSRPAAIRALRAMIIAPGLFALCFEVIGNQAMTVFAVFGSFGALLFASFGGSRRDKAIAYLGLAGAGSVALTIGTLVSGSAWLAAVATIPVAFAIFFAGVAGPNAASGVTAALLAYVLPVASASPVSVIGWRLAGWLLALAVSATAVLLFSPRSAGDRLRASAARTAGAMASHLEAALAGPVKQASLDAMIAAKHDLMNTFSTTPYRPIGLARADQALAGTIHMLEWGASLTADATTSGLDLSNAPAPDKRVLAEATVALRSVTGLLTGRQAGFDLRPIWEARSASAAHMQALTGDQAAVRDQVSYAFHAQAIGLAASAAVADAMIACGRFSPEFVARERRRWVDGLTEGQPDGQQLVIEGQQPRGRWPARVADLVAADASSRSVWFRNSARGAIALAGAVAIARVTNVLHGFWVVLGTLSVLRTSASATGATALRAVAGTVAGFVIGGALLIGIGTSQPTLWAALPLAVLVAAYTPGTAPFAVGQAAFTVTVVVLFNLLDPAGWRVGLVRIEDVALGCAVSATVGILFWPRGAAAVMGDNLAEALRSGADYLTESVGCALSFGRRHPAHAVTAIGAGARLDDAVRGYLTEQGSKRIPKQDLWVLLMAAQRIRLTAHSLASLPGGPAQPAATSSPGSLLGSGYLDLATFYKRIASQVGPPGHDHPAIFEVPLPASPVAPPDPDRAPSPDALWATMHIEQLESHAASLPGPAAKLAALRRTAWWRPPPAQPGPAQRQPG